MNGVPSLGVFSAWLGLCVALWTGAAASAMHQELEVELDPARAALRVRAQVTIAAGTAMRLRLDGSYTIETSRVEGEHVAPARSSQGDRTFWTWAVAGGRERPRTMHLVYRGTLDRIDAAADHRQVLAMRGPIAGPQGAYLPAGTGWHPESVQHPTTYRVRLTLPETDRGTVVGRELESRVQGAHWSATFEQREALPGIDLFAGPYGVAQRDLVLEGNRSVVLRTYFHHELAELAGDYLASAARAIERYDRTIGAYPFASYSIVSSPLPTGFGMPGAAYLGRQVLRLPFIRTTSLVHEVLHNWWGNGVFPDYERGNWSEGLTTFMADYAVREDESESAARDMRRGWLRDFAAVRPELDQPIARFISRRHGAGQAVGYNKTAFVFFMLRDMIGRPAFEAGLREFWARHRLRTAGWDDLRAAFERGAGRELGAFFRQWIERAGAPAVQLLSARNTRASGGRQVAIELAQHGGVFALRLPVRVHFAGDRSLDAVVDLDAAATRIAIDVPERALAITIDPEVRLFRRLEPAELAPTMRQVFIDPRTMTLLAGGTPQVRRAAEELAAATLDHGVRLEDGVPSGAAPRLVVGTHAEVLLALAAAGWPAPPQALVGRGSGFAYAGRSPDGTAYAVVSGRDQAALEQMTRSLPHLGAQSYAVFEGARSSERGVWETTAVRHRVDD